MAFIIALTIGRYHIDIKDVFVILESKLLGVDAHYPEAVNNIVLNVRLPRVIISMLVGASLSVAGAVYQGMFKNPMVSSDILGVSAGAGFGAALAILLSFSVVGIQLMSFIFGILAVSITYAIGKIVGGRGISHIVLILSGMLVGTLFSSFISLIKYVADPFSKLPAITFWLMGSLSSVNNRDVLILIIPFIIGVVPLLLLSWKLNVLSFGEEEGKALGVNTKALRLTSILCSTLITASSVSICGLIGWVGIIVPHICRMLVGPNLKKLIPATLSCGSIYLLIVDTLSRSLFSIEIPLGILTSIIGAPFFILLLLNKGRGWNETSS